jgi:5-methylcytosine-specific restriction endonuclease McrA
VKTTSKWLENVIIQIRDHDSEIAKNETAILQLLLEIEARKEYAARGFDGLYSFCIKTFGWSESQTSTRTQAMYALRAVPEVKEKIDSGAMSLTTVAQVQRLIRQEQTDAGIKRTPEEKRQFFESFENKTSTQVKEAIAARKGERIRLKLALELDEEAEGLWTQVRNLSAHQTQGSALNCLKILMKTYINQKTKAPKVRRTSSSLTKVSSISATKTTLAPSSTTSAPSPTTPGTTAPVRKTQSAPQSAQLSSTHSSSPKKPAAAPTRNPISQPARFIPAETCRQIYARDQDQCRNCSSRHALQIDHIQPIAKGGTNEPDNLQLLCRNCNLQKAIRDFGYAKLRKHLDQSALAS